jgi:hypothetical protein
MMGGIVGRLFREFAVTLSVAIAVSLLPADDDADDVHDCFAGSEIRTAASPHQ